MRCEEKVLTIESEVEKGRIKGKPQESKKIYDVNSGLLFESFLTN